MRLLLDTHVILWLMEANPKLSTELVGKLRDFDNELLISMASIWEISIKSSIGKMKLRVPFHLFLEIAIRDYSVQPLPITEMDCVEANRLPFLNPNHKDPFDRMILSQAIRQGLAIVSADQAFDAYPVHRIW